MAEASTTRQPASGGISDRRSNGWSPTGRSRQIAGLAPDRDALTRVLARPQLVHMAFQPIIDLQRGVVCGYEALARFPQGAAPDVWLAAARAHGLGERLEAMLARHALDARAHLPGNCFLSINTSPEALASSDLAEVLEHGNLNAVVLEVTEQTDAPDDTWPDPTLRALRHSGAFLAVDDAGSGYGSLHRIVQLRPAFVKIDAALVTGLHEDPAKVAAIEMLGAFASRIDAWLIAEGVERIEELEELARLGVPLAQGYLFARPGPRMSAISPELGRLARQRFAAPTRPLDLARLLEQAPAIAEDGRSRRSFLSHPAKTAVIVDARHRPVALLSGKPSDGGQVRRPLLVHASAEVADIARRAMTRPPAERFDPLVCCDDAGRYVGLLPINRLLIALSEDSVNRSSGPLREVGDPDFPPPQARSDERSAP